MPAIYLRPALMKATSSTHTDDRYIDDQHFDTGKQYLNDDFIYDQCFQPGRVKQQAYIEIAEQSFAHLHTLSLQWHLKKKMGNVVRSMDRGTDAANNLITYLFLYLVPAIAECIATVSRSKVESKTKIELQKTIESESEKRIENENNRIWCKISWCCRNQSRTDAANNLITYISLPLPRPGDRGVCVFFTLNRGFYPWTSNTPSVRADSSILERYRVCAHKTTPQRDYIVRMQ